MNSKCLTLSLWLISNFIFAQPKSVVAMEREAFGNFFLNAAIPVVRGQVLNLTPEEIKQVKIKYSIVTPFSELQTTKNAELNLDGTFELKLDYAFPFQQVWLSVGELFYTGIYANTELHIELDAQQLKVVKDAAFNAAGVKFLGKDGELNTYANNHILYHRDKQLAIYNVAWNLKYKRMDHSVFMQKFDSLYALFAPIGR